MADPDTQPETDGGSVTDWHADGDTVPVFISDGYFVPFERPDGAEQDGGV